MGNEVISSEIQAEIKRLTSPENIENIQKELEESTGIKLSEFENRKDEDYDIDLDFSDVEKYAIECQEIEKKISEIGNSHIDGKVLTDINAQLGKLNDIESQLKSELLKAETVFPDELRDFLNSKITYYWKK